ncbi:MAG: hypothetical protein ACRYGF_15230 [Janthinobacterium lividum]
MTAGRLLRQRVQSSADAFVRITDERTVLIFAGLSLLYAAVVVVLSSFKLLWLDELITLFIVRLGSAAAIWHALQLGADPNPPFSHLCVLLSRSIFGEGALALRLPAAVGYWVGLCSLFTYLKLRLSPIWALAGTCMSMAMAAFDYSFESRSYGIVYGLSMFSFLCWATAVQQDTPLPRRSLAIACMTLSLALGVCTNYFAILALIPIGIGELVRYFARHRIGGSASASTLPVWSGLLASLLPLILFRRLIEQAIAQYSPYAWNHVSLQGLLDCYTETVESTLLPLLLLFSVAAVLLFVAPITNSLGRHRSASYVQRFRAGSFGVPLHEAAAVLALMAYPVFAFAIASVHGGMLSPRFVLPVCLGFAVAGTIVIYRISGTNPRVAVALVCLCTAWFLARETYVAQSYARQRQSFANLVTSVDQATKTMPQDGAVAVPDPLIALPLEHYADASLRGRLVFPVDFAAVRRFRHDDSPEENLWAAKDLIPTLRVITLTQFEAKSGPFLIVAAEGNWLLQELNERRYPAILVPIAINTDDIGGFTPLAHGLPRIFEAHGDENFRSGAFFAPTSSGVAAMPKAVAGAEDSAPRPSIPISRPGAHQQ